MLRKASAVWRGGLKDGKGVVSTDSAVLSSVPYNFNQRFGDEPGTNPEELVAAAMASCYSMKLSGVLGASNLVPDSIETKAHLTFEKGEAGFGVSKIHLVVVGKVPNATAEIFAAAAEDARKNCPISGLLKTTITVDAKLTT